MRTLFRTSEATAIEKSGEWITVILCVGLVVLLSMTRSTWLILVLFCLVPTIFTGYLFKEFFVGHDTKVRSTKIRIWILHAAALAAAILTAVSIPADHKKTLVVTVFALTFGEAILCSLLARKGLFPLGTAKHSA